MNLAAVWQLPVLFICENNQYALTAPAGKFVAGGGVARRADAYGMHGEKVDGQDVLAVFRAVQDAAGKVRKESYPRVLELETYRFREHAELGSVALGYRTNEEIENWKQRDPIALCRDVLVKTHAVPRERLDEIEATIGHQVDSAVDRARSHELPAKSQLFCDVFAPPLGLDPEAWGGAPCES
jgi:pyruvate dehydrogenase E1 component alpha subunit